MVVMTLALVGDKITKVEKNVQIKSVSPVPLIHHYNDGRMDTTTER